jgi:hypothetical protein
MDSLSFHLDHEISQVLKKKLARFPLLQKLSTYIAKIPILIGFIIGGYTSKLAEITALKNEKYSSKGKIFVSCSNRRL